MSLQEKCNQELEVLEVNYSKGAMLGTRRQYVAARSVYSHVKPLNPVQVEVLKAKGSNVTHDIWFYEDPQLQDGQRLRWVNKGVVMEVTGVPQDLHGLGRVWMGTASTNRKDNEDVEVIS